MAHNLEERDGRASFVYTRQELPWHGLGEPVEEAMTVEEAMIKCRADFSVRKDNLLRITEEELELISKGLPLNKVFTQEDVIDTHQVTVREDLNRKLGVVGSGYEVVQNLQAFTFVDDILKGISGFSAPRIQTAGVLGKGERIFVSAKFDTPIKINGTDDEISDYVIFTTSHDGSGAVVATFTPTRVVCNNTLNFALHNSKNKIYFRHTKNVHSKLDLTNKNNLNMALSVMRGHQVYIQDLNDTMSKLANIKVNEKDILKVTAGVFLEPNVVKDFISANYNIDRIDVSTRAKNTINGVIDTIDRGVGQEKWRGTGLGLVNGFTSYFQNSKTYKQGQLAKFDSIIDGDANKKVQKALNLVLDLAA